MTSDKIPQSSAAHGHDHLDGRGHEHGHTGSPAREAVAPTTPSQSVMVNVGDTAGALVLSARSELAGKEIEIHPVGEPTQRTHVWVLPRTGRDGITFAAIFPCLEVGDYAIVASDGSTLRTVSIPPNEVTFSTWE